MEVGAPGNAPSEFYIFTQELNADEEKLGVPVAVYTLTEITVHKGDKVTIHFYNTAENATDRHTFTMLDPYKMSYDLAGGENKTFSFTADTVGRFTYYCTYDLPSMIGQLEVLPWANLQIFLSRKNRASADIPMRRPCSSQGDV